MLSERFWAWRGHAIGEEPSTARMRDEIRNCNHKYDAAGWRRNDARWEGRAGGMPRAAVRCPLQNGRNARAGQRIVNRQNCTIAAVRRRRWCGGSRDIFWSSVASDGKFGKSSPPVALLQCILELEKWRRPSERRGLGEARGSVGAPRCADATTPEQQLLALCLLHRGGAGAKDGGQAATDSAKTSLPSVPGRPSFRVLRAECDSRR